MWADKKLGNSKRKRKIRDIMMERGEREGESRNGVRNKINENRTFCE